MNKYKAVSLFSSSGIGELGMEANEIEIITANELLSNRCQIYSENYPDTNVIPGSIWEVKEKIITDTLNKLNGEELFMVYATPPCQGMSSNGAGKILSEIAAGRRPEIDERNRLVIPAMEIINKLNPRWVLFENVPAMKDTIIELDGKPWNIIDYISSQLGDEYIGGSTVISCSDYGVPQLRKRLLTVFTRDENGKKFLVSNNNSLFMQQDKAQPISIMEAIGDLPKLDAVPGKNSALNFSPYHYVNVMNEEKYWWVSNTRHSDTAYNNQCVNPDCLFQGNPEHIDQVIDGKSTSSKTTPIICIKCGSLLPRPSMIDKITGERRLISGFHSAYRRMDGSKPSRTLTMNFPFEASDNKIHPTQNRVLSIYEALVIQTIARYDYKWTIGGKPVNRSLIVHSIGESVPPVIIDKACQRMIEVSSNLITMPQAPKVQQRLSLLEVE